MTTSLNRLGSLFNKKQSIFYYQNDPAYRVFEDIGAANEEGLVAVAILDFGTPAANVIKLFMIHKYL
jgi:hypothetical protein